ncbi:hypothetical protein EGW08_022975, partial [Elysia chlorotica]
RPLIPQFISLQKLTHEDLDLGILPNGETTTAAATESARQGLSRSLQAQLDCELTMLQEIKVPRDTESGEIDGDAHEGTNLIGATEFADRTEENQRSLDPLEFSICQCHNDYRDDALEIVESHVEEITPQIVLNDEFTVVQPGTLSTAKPSQTPLTHCSRCSKQVLAVSENGQATSFSHPPDSSSHQTQHHTRLYEPNHHLKHNHHHNHFHHQRFHHHHDHNHQQHPHHLKLDQCPVGSQSTVCGDFSETESVASGRPVLHKSDLLNVLPEMLGSLSTLSVNTAHSAHSAHSRHRALRHRKAAGIGGIDHMTGPADSRQSLALGSKLTLAESEGLPLEAHGKDFGHPEEDGEELEQATFSSWELFKIVRFDLFCVGAFLVQMASIIPTMFVPSYIVSAGLSASSAASMVSILGISNTSGRLCAGFLSYLGIDTIRIYNGGTFLAGVACFLLPLCSTFPSLVAFAVCHGFF